MVADMPLSHNLLALFRSGVKLHRNARRSMVPASPPHQERLPMAS